MDRALPDEALEAAAADVATSLRGLLAGSAGKGRIDEAAREAVPVLEATLAATQTGRTHTDRHEALALAALLGRRAVALGLSPTATLALAEAVVTVARARGADVDRSLEIAIASCAMEGHVAGETEAVRAEVDERAAACVRPFRLADRMLGVAIFASVGPDALETALDGVARKILETDSEACVALISGTPPERDLRAFVSALTGLGTAAGMVGARVVYAIENEPLRQAMSEVAGLRDAVVASFVDALAALEASVLRGAGPLDRLRGILRGR